jgi:hypothetical protein
VRLHSIRQPGDLRETHGFPSLPRDRFGVVRECLLLEFLRQNKISVNQIQRKTVRQ